MNKWLPALQVTGIGFFIAICIFGGAFLGWWWGGKRPIFTIIGLAGGLIVAVYGAYRMIKPFLDNNSGKRNNP